MAFYKDIAKISSRNGPLFGWRLACRTGTVYPMSRCFFVDIVKHPSSSLSTGTRTSKIGELAFLRRSSFETLGGFHSRWWYSGALCSFSRTFTDRSNGKITGESFKDDSKEGGPRQADSVSASMKEQSYSQDLNAGPREFDNLSDGESTAAKRGEEDEAVRWNSENFGDAKTLSDDKGEGCEEVTNTISLDNSKLTDHQVANGEHGEEDVKAAAVVPSFRLRKGK